MRAPEGGCECSESGFEPSLDGISCLSTQRGFWNLQTIIIVSAGGVAAIAGSIGTYIAVKRCCKGRKKSVPAAPEGASLVKTSGATEAAQSALTGADAVADAVPE